MTQSVRIESRVGKDGVLTLRVPLAPSDADTDVIVTIESKARRDKPRPEANWPSGYFDETFGCLMNDPLTIPDDPAPTPEAME